MFFDSLGLATAAVGMATAAWLTVALAFRPGTIDGNLPPGVSVDSVLGLMVVGASITAIYTFANYRDRVYPFKMVEHQMERDDAVGDPSPLERSPEDSPQ